LAGNILSKAVFRTHIPAHFDVAYSLLGRFLRWRETDRIVAENKTIFAATLIGVALVVGAQFFSSTLGIEHFVLSFAYVAVCIIGWKPGFDVHCDQESLRISGKDQLVIPAGDITSVIDTSALSYHRGWRRRAHVKQFVNRVGSRVLIIEHAGSTVALGLPDPDSGKLHAFLGGMARQTKQVVDLQPAQVA